MAMPMLIRGLNYGLPADDNGFYAGGLRRRCTLITTDNKSGGTNRQLDARALTDDVTDHDHGHGHRHGLFTIIIVL